MGKVEGKEIEIKGKKLVCPVCDGIHFNSRDCHLFSDSITIRLCGFDVAYKETTNYICVNCKYMFWFVFDQPSTHNVYGIDKHDK